MHEAGGTTGSKGWGYVFSQKEAEQILLRTHTTVLSAQTIAKLKKEDLPAKFFAVGKVFRNEALDWKHLFEFYQVEGIVIDPQANLQHLKGYLREFYKKMGFPDVRMRPGYFPYTSPSLEVDVFHPVKKEWVELGGAGMIHPNVIKAGKLDPKKYTGFAFGWGVERTIAMRTEIGDIRLLFQNDIRFLEQF